MALPHCARAKASTGPDKFRAIAEAAAGLPDAIIDGEVVALDDNGAPDFAALQAALSEGRSQDLVYFVFDLLFDGGEDLRALPLTERKARLKALAGKEQGHGQHSRTSSISGPGDAVLQSACRLNLEGIISKRSVRPTVRPHRDLDQIQMPRRP